MKKILCVNLFLLTSAAAAPTTQPLPQLREMSDAYSRLKTLSLAGTIDLTADIDGRNLQRHADFIDAFGGNNRFRHEVKQDVIASCNGDKVYIYRPAENLYVDESAPADGTLPEDAERLLKTQDISLDLALSGDAAGELLAGSTGASANPDGSIRVSFPDRDITLTLDPKTHLISRVVTDLSRGLSSRGARVKSAQITLDYATSAADAAISPEALAFTPPPTADEQPVPEVAAASDLAGKPAPHFRIPKLDGGDSISDASLRGSVYILDFWATWCGPCVASLPGLDEIYKQRKAAGLKVFAVNEQEDAATIQKFIAQSKLTIPAVLDSDGKTGAAFGAQAIPETVVVGKDGVVRNVFVGAGNEQAIAAAADAALHDIAPAP